MKKLLTRQFLCATIKPQEAKRGLQKVEITIVVLSLILVIENAIAIPLLIRFIKKHNKIKEEMRTHKQSKDFHINQLKNRYKGVEENYETKRNSRKM